MAGITQYYKSRVLYGGTQANPDTGTPLPVPPNGAMLNWGSNYVVPMIAGNYWQFNFIEGAQTPMIDLQIACLDGDANRCPLDPTLLNAWFLTRSANYSHDTTGVEGFTFFDGYSGFHFDYVKWNSFSISGSKGDDVSFRGNCMAYAPANPPSTDARWADVGYASMTDSQGFEGAPIRFQSLSFEKNSGTCLNGIVSFSLSFSNNLSADSSMVCAQSPDENGNYQNPLPVDCNAGMMSCSAQFTFQSHNEDAIVNGDSIDIYIRQGAIQTQMTLKEIINDTRRNRAVGFGRQMRTYNCIVTGGDGATIPPLVVAAP